MSNGHPLPILQWTTASRILAFSMIALVLASTGVGLAARLDPRVMTFLRRAIVVEQLSPAARATLLEKLKQLKSATPVPDPKSMPKAATAN